MTASADAAVLLATEGLSKNFGGLEVVRSVDFSLERGARHALIGPNGAGKTTLVNLLTGALRPSAGRIRIAGADATDTAEADRVSRGLVRTFQINQLFRSLSVFENVCLAVSQRVGAARSLWRTSRAWRAVTDEAMAILGELRLDGVAFRPVRELPYGSLRLVEIAIALGLRPRILLMDEPAAGIPADERDLILGVVGRLDPDIAILIIEHDMDLVFRFAREITVLVNGAVLTRGTADEIAADPRVREVYLGTAGHG
jgi:ABC-type branched-subunit amino acid transport system ATPase component